MNPLLKIVGKKHEKKKMKPDNGVEKRGYILNDSKLSESKIPDLFKQKK
jgi:hypothetical protein